jgi:hypothetical protein
VTLEEFRATVSAGVSPDGPPLLRALWLDAAGRWNEAHQVAQEVDTNDGAWVHAYLHRRDGDLGNARYWYGRAARPEPTDSLESEWTRLVAHLLSC